MIPRHLCAERLANIRQRYLVNSQLEECGVTTPANLGAVTGLPAAAAVSLLTRRR